MESPKKYEDFKTSCFGAIYSKSVNFILEEMNWEKGDVILDYGCGSGQFVSKYLLPFVEKFGVKKIYGVDKSSEMLKFAQKNESNKDLLVEFSVGDLMNEKIRFLNGVEVNKFVSILVLCYVEDYRLFFKNLWNLVKPGGEVAFVVPFALANGIPYKLLSTEKWSKFYDLKDEDCRLAKWVYEIQEASTDFKGPLQAAGFNVLKYESIDTTFSFENVHSLCEFLGIISTTVNYIPNELKSEFIQDMAKLATDYLKIQKPYDGIQVDWTFVNILAQKPI